MSRKLLIALALVVVTATLIGFASSTCFYQCDENAVDDIYTASLQASGRSWKDRRTDSRRHPADVLRFSGVESGMVVIDMLGGGGYYSELFSTVVGESGQVYLQNNSLFLRFSREGMEKRLRRNRLANVVRLDSEFADMKLPSNADLIFLGLSYHDIYVPREDPVIMTSREEFFPQIWSALKPGGKILVIDHAAAGGSGNSAAARLHRIDEEYAVRDFECAGYRLLGRLDVLRNTEDQYDHDIWDDAVKGQTDRFVLLFEKPVSVAGSTEPYVVDPIEDCLGSL